MAEETGAPTPAGPDPQPDVVRTEDFASTYSNNVQFEQNALDLKVIFGALDLRGGKITIEQHTSVTMSWVQAKLLSFFLNVNLVAHEAENGKIKIPSKMLPPMPPLPRELENNPQVKAVVEVIRKMREEFIANLSA